MCDKLVFDLAQEIEATPTVFVRKDWINILDNQNQNYNNNQSVIDTSQLSNSNKYMSYREAYLTVPMVLTLGCSSGTLVANAGATGTFTSDISATADYAIGLKNWFGQIIHSFTLDYNGTTIIQQTPYINFWNSFKLMTSLSYGDVITQGATIGFFPDDPQTFTIRTAASADGIGICNNTDFRAFDTVTGLSVLSTGKGNSGFLKRQQLINFDGLAVAGTAQYNTLVGAGATTLGNYTSWANTIWKSCIYKKQSLVANYTNGSDALSVTTPMVVQFQITAIIYLKHIHSFFNMCPLIKGAFMKMTMNLNNTSTTLTLGGAATSTLTYTGVASPLGGVNPVMIASNSASNGFSALATALQAIQGTTAAQYANYTLTANISVGARCLDSTISGTQEAGGPKSIYLYVPAYTFNPVFEQAYLSSPVKSIRYSDVYQYQILNVVGGGSQTFNNLLTNGIAHIKSVLLLPFLSATATAGTGSYVAGSPEFQSPFDPAGTGPTAPLAHITNFNVQVSGQNAIYNLQKYNFEQFNNQLYGQNAVNGGLTDGLTSSLIDRQAFDLEYCYYYVNVERMLPVEQSVPKSVQVLGTNLSARAIDYYCFIEYGQEVSIDILTGARV